MARKEKEISTSIIITVNHQNILQEQIPEDELKKIKEKLLVRFMENYGYRIANDKIN